MRMKSAIKWSLLGAFLLFGIGIAIAYSQGQFSGSSDARPLIALVGARVYDPTSDSILERVTIVIRDREIVAVGPLVAIPDSAEVLRVSGLTLLPGFIDSHVHMSAIRPKEPNGRRSIGPLAYFWKFIRKFPDRRRMLIESGVTTIKSFSDPLPWIVKLAQRIERHELAGPRIFTAGPSFTAPGGHPVARLRTAGQGDTSFIAQVTRQVADTGAARDALNQISRRVQFVSTVLETQDRHNLPSMTSDVLRTITAAAHASDLRVVAHVASLRDLERALAAEVDGIEHLPVDERIDSATLAFLYERSIFVDPTLTRSGYVGSGFVDDSASAAIAWANVRRLHAAGVPLVVGSDAPNPGAYYGSSVHDEMRNLVRAGLRPGEAIAAATSAAAEHMGLSDRLGSIAPGRWADIVGVAGDPLIDIVATSDIYLVIADGQVLVDRLAQVPKPQSVIVLRSRTGKPLQ